MMPGRTTVVDYWDFFQDNDGRWRWRYSSAEEQRVSECAQGYATPDDCIADARRHGYRALNSRSSHAHG